MLFGNFELGTCHFVFKKTDKETVIARFRKLGAGLKNLVQSIFCHKQSFCRLFTFKLLYLTDIARGIFKQEHIIFGILRRADFIHREHQRKHRVFTVEHCKRFIVIICIGNSMNFIRKLQIENKVVVCDSVSVGQLTSVDFGKLFAYFGVFRKIGSISLLRKLTPSAFNILFGNAETCSILHELMKSEPG